MITKNNPRKYHTNGTGLHRDYLYGINYFVKMKNNKKVLNNSYSKIKLFFFFASLHEEN